MKTKRRIVGRAECGRLSRLSYAVNEAAVILVSHGGEGFQDDLDKGIRLIAAAAGLDRLSLWRNFTTEDGALRSNELFRWAAEQGGVTRLDSDIDNFDAETLMPRWHETLGRGEPIVGLVKDMPENERIVLNRYNCRSMVVMPVFTNDRLWGFLIFEDTKNDRLFVGREVELLRSAAAICADALLKHDMADEVTASEERIRDKERLLRAITHASETFLSQVDDTYENVMSRGIETIADAAGVGRVTVWRAVEMATGRVGSRIKQIYHWDKIHGTMSETAELNDVDYGEAMPRFVEALARGQIINGSFNPENPFEERLKAAWGLESVLFIPLFMGGKYWGFALWEDTENRRVFGGETVEILRTASYICANTKIRYDSTVQIAAASKQLRRRGELMAALNVTAVEYITQGRNNFDDTMTTGIEALAKAARMQRVAIYRDVGDGERFDHVYRWVKGSRCTSDSPVYLRNLKYSENCPFWGAALARGEILNVTLGESDGLERKFIDQFGIKSMLVVPVHVHNMFWGFVTFQDLETERAYSDLSVEALNSAALICANTLIHHDMTQREVEQLALLAFRLEQQEFTASVVQTLVRSGDVTALIDEALGKIGVYMAVSRVVVVMLNRERNTVDVVCGWYSDPEWAFPDGTYYERSITHIDHFSEHISQNAAIPVETCSDVTKHESPDVRGMAAEKTKSVMWTPLYVDERLWGMLSVEQCDCKREWEDKTRLFLPTVASSIAGAVMRGIYDKQRADAMEKAIDASKAKGAFLSNMSHEMRTPLNAIIGMTTIGKQADTPERKDYSFAKIEEASKHLLGVINDVLDMSKIEADKMELSPVEFTFEKMLQKVVGVVNFRAGEKGQRITVSVDPRVPKVVSADEQRLAQIITNLLSNAVKFTHEGGDIKIETNYDGEDGGCCRLLFKVADNGIGISEEQQGNLFESFQQADNNTSRKYGGTGLGLAISKRIVEMMGGEIWIDSTPGVGSVFSFTVLVKRVDSSSANYINYVVDRGNLRVGVVARSGEIGGYMSELFAKLGVMCDVAESAADMAEKAKDRACDIYFIDLETAGGEGETLSDSFLDGDVKPFAVVAAVTAAEWADMSRGEGVPWADKFLIKPLFASSVVDCVNDCLGGSVSQSSDVEDGEFSGKRVLLVEDVEINRDIFMSLLEDTGVDIACATDGVEAVRVFKNRAVDFDVILMDVQMPNMDGLEATRRIRALANPSGDGQTPDPRAATVPIVAMTANVFKEDVDRCIEAGMNDHIGKPIDMDDVMSKLRKYLSRRRRRI